MPYRHTDNVARKLRERRDAILTAARDALCDGGLAAVQIAPVAERAGVAAGTVYRYFASKADLVAALVSLHSADETAAMQAAAQAAPGPLSGLSAAITLFAARAISAPRLIFALSAEPVEPAVDAARNGYRRAVAAQFEELIRGAMLAERLPEQDPATSAAALVGALLGALGPPAAPPSAEATAHARIQAMALLGLRALGVADAQARGLVVQTPIPKSG